MDFGVSIGTDVSFGIHEIRCAEKLDIEQMFLYRDFLQG